jgi:hypothetical protein
MIFSNQKLHGVTWPMFVELGAPKMEGQCQISIQFLKNKICFFLNKLDPLDYVKI